MAKTIVTQAMLNKTDAQWEKEYKGAHNIAIIRETFQLGESGWKEGLDKFVPEKLQAQFVAFMKDVVNACAYTTKDGVHIAGASGDLIGKIIRGISEDSYIRAIVVPLAVRNARGKAAKAEKEAAKAQAQAAGPTTKGGKVVTPKGKAAKGATAAAPAPAGIDVNALAVAMAAAMASIMNK